MLIVESCGERHVGVGDRFSVFCVSEVCRASRLATAGARSAYAPRLLIGGRYFLARATRRSKRSKWTNEPGKLADLTVLSAEIMKLPAHEILKTTCARSVIGGEVVFAPAK